MAIALALEKSTKAARKSHVSRNITDQVQGREGEKEDAVPNRGHGRGRRGPVEGTKMSPKGVKFLTFCKKYFCLQNPIWPPVARPVPRLAFKGLKPVYRHNKYNVIAN